MKKILNDMSIIRYSYRTVLTIIGFITSMRLFADSENSIYVFFTLLFLTLMCFSIKEDTKRVIFYD